MTRVTAWMKKHRVRVLLYPDEKKPAFTPTADWWILLLYLDSVATIIAETGMCLQGLKTLLSQQLAQFKVLAVSLLEMCTVAGPLSTKQLTGLDSGTVVSQGLYSVAFADAKAFIRYQGVFVMDVFAALPPEGADAIVPNVANLFSGLYSGIVAVVATQDSGNQRSPDELPPVLPHSLAAIRPAEVTELIRPQRGRLVKAGWSEAQIEQIEQGHRDLRHASSSEALFKELLGKCSDTLTSFDEGWGLCQGRFDSLR